MNGQRVWRLLLLFLLLPLGGLLLPATARATVSCTASMTDLTFGSYDPQQGATTATATLTWTCTNDGFLLTGSSINACFSIGTGSGGNSTNPRQIAGARSPLKFQMYRDPGHSLVWGSSSTSSTPVPAQINVTLAWLEPSRSGTLTLYGMVPGNQNGVAAGMYTSSFGGPHTMISYNSAEGVLGPGPMPGSCGTANRGSFPFTVNAGVQQACTVTVGTLDFGNVAGLLATNRDAQSTLGVQCLDGTAYKVGLDDGQHGTRRMAGAGGSVGYELYLDSARTRRWGNTPGTDTHDAAGTGSTQNLVVYGRVPPQPTPAAGTYTDTVTVTVTY